MRGSMSDWRRIVVMSVWTIGVFALLAACAPIQPVAEVSAQEAPDEDMAAIVDGIWRQYEATMMDGDVEAWGELWVDEGVQMPPDAPVNSGKEVITSFVGGFHDVIDVTDMVIDNQEIQAFGDWAFVRGLYTIDGQFKEGGAPYAVDGKYMSILQRQADGSWKIFRDIFNSNVPPAPGTVEETDTVAVTEAILAVWEEYEASALAGSADRRMALWAEDGVQMPPNTLPRVGKETIRSATEAGMGQVITEEFVITNEEVEVDGDMAFARGTYSVKRTPVAGGETVETDGKYMTIFKRQADGSWKIYRDIFNSNVPPGE